MKLHCILGITMYWRLSRLGRLRTGSWSCGGCCAFSSDIMPPSLRRVDDTLPNKLGTRKLYPFELKIQNFHQVFTTYLTRKRAFFRRYDRPQTFVRDLRKNRSVFFAQTRNQRPLRKKKSQRPSWLIIFVQSFPYKSSLPAKVIKVDILWLHS